MLASGEATPDFREFAAEVTDYFFGDDDASGVFGKLRGTSNPSKLYNRLKAAVALEKDEPTYDLVLAYQREFTSTLAALEPSFNTVPTGDIS